MTLVSTTMNGCYGISYAISVESAAVAVVGGVGVIVADNRRLLLQGPSHVSVVSLTSASIAKKSSNPNLCAGETNTDQQRSNTAEVAEVNITVQSAIRLACLLASKFLTSIVAIVDGLSRG